VGAKSSPPPAAKEKIMKRGQFLRAASLATTVGAAIPATLIGMAATPTLGQTETPAAASIGSGNQSAASIPDFHGIWGRVSFPGFAPPVTGPGPVINKKRERNGTSSLYGYVGDYTNPILKPQAAEAVKKHGEVEQSGALALNARNQCWPEGVPFILTNVGMQMVQQPDKITILYADTYEIRRVRMNQPHPEHVTPSWYGDSVGHYEGDTLVIDTVGIKTNRPYAIVDWFGTPYSEALHVVERYRLLDYSAAKEAETSDEKVNFGVPVGFATEQGFAKDPEYKGNGLQLVLTVEDEGVFTTPWSATMIYLRPLSPLGQWPEVVCSENAGFDGGYKATVPTADKPDF
jgi:hypothetical protein